VEQAFFAIDKAVYWEQRMRCTEIQEDGTVRSIVKVSETRFDWGMSGIVAWERLDKEVAHSSYQNREFLPFQHPDLQFMFTAPDHDLAIFISSPEFINHSTVTRQEYADLPLKTYASVQLANVVTMQEPHLWIQKVYKEMQDPTNKYWDT
ncbi:hypothetical protein CYMTET_26829, partial [Cymbomonas tetramitiformis]